MQDSLTQELQQTVLSVSSNRLDKLKPTRFVVNWGSSNAPNTIPNCTILNSPWAVGIASNKLRTFNYWSDSGVSCPLWTTDFDKALEWVDEGTTVFCRTRIQAHSGNGIIIATHPDHLVQSQLYTKYIKKKKEFRVHVFNQEVIDVQEKRRTVGSDASFLIRNHANGFVFCRDNIIEPSDLRDVANHAVTALGLNFGAVDIVWNEHYDKCYALEVNTAPGLEGTTLERYTTKIKELAYGH